MDKPSKPLSRFVSRNIITIVMVPFIIGAHIGWNALQKNRALVKEGEEIELPVVTFFKYCLRRLNAGEEPKKIEDIRTENP